ncbi:MAG: response regulator transcription factor [Chloroflexales bacterium]|nr:response regulator transcription factor [Chloroflexales bacterium]
MSAILIVDDDRNITRLVRGYLEQAGFTVLIAHTRSEAWHCLRRAALACLVLDLGLPDGDGWDMTRQIRGDRQLGALPVIMLTARVEESDRIIGLELGADDYIVKPFNPREVVARVKALLRRRELDRHPAQQQLQAGDLRLDIGQRVAYAGDTPIDLTPTEFQLLHILMEHPGYTFTRDDLLDKTLGYSYEGAGRTLDTHIKNLRHKIEPDPKRPSYIITVHRVGYRFHSEPLQSGARRAPKG